MPKRMLIDGTHPEETRVVVMNQNRVEDYDIETSTKKQLKGNIYLAKVTRVEPSLQAAFVDYGGNRHGFLAFGEIHPDYYQIPLEDREALKADQAYADEARAAQEHLDDIDGGVVDVVEQPHDEPEPGHNHGNGNGDGNGGAGMAAESHLDATIAAPLPETEAGPLADAEPAPDELDIPPGPSSGEPHEQPAASYEYQQDTSSGASNDTQQPGETGGYTTTAGLPANVLPDVPPTAELALGEAEATPDQPEQPAYPEQPEQPPYGEARGPLPGAERALEQPPPRRRRHRHYRIQEVIKRRQIILVQVVKEERGNKGAALTTYLSLAGRYCVLMPNTARGGGVSRKITSPAARRKLKDMLAELAAPEGMAVIIRTAGIERNKAEVKRDFEYLLRAWDEIRELTLKSTAPALVYEEASLIKRAIRDLYSKDIDEIHVEGDEAYQTAKTFMRLMMPSHAARVQHYSDPTLPLFHRYQVEGQLDAMHSPTVQLKSGGYIVIHATEALVAIDVNSGRATRERNIEETALRTNCEAAEEVALQLRLRDLAGLIVVDFIDMEDSRNVRNVERRFREAVKNDRARIQLGRISSFGLMDLSRQRLRPSLLETSGQVCPHCQGTGHVRSIESSAIRVLRRIEEEGIRTRSAELSVSVPPAIALYLLNQKRIALVEIENRYNFRIQVKEDPTLIAPDMKIERLGPRPETARPIQLPQAPPPIVDEALEAADRAAAAAEEAGAAEIEEMEAAEPGEEAVTVEPRQDGQPQGEERRGRRRRRRRGRRPGEERGEADQRQAERGPDRGERAAQTPYPQQHISYGAPHMGAAEPEPYAGAEPEAFEVRVEPPPSDGGEPGERPPQGEGYGGGAGEPREGGRRRRRRRGRRGGRGRREDGQPVAAGMGPQPEAAFAEPHEPREPHEARAPYEPHEEVTIEPPRPPRPPRPVIDVVPPWRKQQQAEAQPSPSPEPEPRRETFPEARHDVTPPAHVAPVAEAHEAAAPVPEPVQETFPESRQDVTPPAHVEPVRAPEPARPEPPPIVEEPPLPPGQRRKGWWSKLTS